MFVDQAVERLSIGVGNINDFRPQKAVAINMSDLNDAGQLHILRDLKSKTHAIADIRGRNRQYLYAAVADILD